MLEKPLRVWALHFFSPIPVSHLLRTEVQTTCLGSGCPPRQPQPARRPLHTRLSIYLPALHFSEHQDVGQLNLSPTRLTSTRNPPPILSTWQQIASFEVSAVPQHGFTSLSFPSKPDQSCLCVPHSDLAAPASQPLENIRTPVFCFSSLKIIKLVYCKSNSRIFH